MSTSVAARLPAFALSDISELAANSPPQRLLLCFSHLRWDFVFQRPQHLLMRASREWRVLFIEEPIFDQQLTAQLRRRVAKPNIEIITPHLPQGISAEKSCEVQRKLIDQLLAEDPAAIDVIWYYTPMALPVARHLESRVCVYDCMDELSGFRGAPDAIVTLERELLNKADVVFTGGVCLYEAKRARHSNIHAFPSSIDVDHFGQARHDNLPEPDDLHSIPYPRLVYFGVIDERMDIQLVDELALQRPDWSIVMIGPVVKIDSSSLPRHPNIHWLGMKSYDVLPAYLAHASIGIMPFAINAATRFISPTKTPEFLAAGIPVISTPIRDVVRGYGEAGLVSIAPDARGFATEVEKWLAGPPRDWLIQVDAKLRQGSWNQTWREMSSIIHESASRTAQLEMPAFAGTSPDARR